MTNIWTKIVVILLILFGLWSISGLSRGASPVQVSFEVVLLGVLAVVAWKEIEWGAILVAVAGEAVSGLGFVFTYLNLTPEFGPQSGQYILSATTLLIPLFSYLSYTRIKKRRISSSTSAQTEIGNLV